MVVAAVRALTSAGWVTPAGEGTHAPRADALTDCEARRVTSGDDPRAGLEPTTPLGLATDETAAAEGEARGGGSRERLSEGRLLAGRWRIVRFIAAGGMGEVYEAEDATLGERVALKTIRGDVASDPRAVERFKREVLLARKVAHPNVCRLFELGTDGGLLFFTRELLEGETLAARIAARGRLAVDEARPIATLLCAALEAAHAAGIVHRDLKATNVILVGQRVVVTDFGLARALGGGASDAGQQSSMTGAFVGTPAYMAPEQVEGGRWGRRPISTPSVWCCSRCSRGGGRSRGSRRWGWR
jgi:serine/threonine protein kinase